MNLKTLISRYLSVALLALAVVCAIAPAFMPSASYDTTGVSSHVSKRLGNRMERLSSFGEQLLAEPARNGVWPRMGNLPDDMVLYRYCADTLHSWYNLLGAMPQLERLSEEPQYINLGRRWYIARLAGTPEDFVVEALLVKDEDRVNVARGQDGVNSHIHLHGKYDIAALGAEDGADVKVGSTPVFSIVVSDGADQSNTLSSMSLRWAAVILLVLSSLVFLRFHRSAANCLYTVLLLMAVAFVCKSWASTMVSVQLFSPVLYAHDGLLDSFGVLLIFNAAIFLSFMAMFMCRDALVQRFADGPRAATVFISLLSLVLVLSVVYLFYTLSSIVMNSGITLELYRISIINAYTFWAYASYAFMVVGQMLLCEIILCAVNHRRNTSFTMFRISPMLVFCSLAAAAILFEVTMLGFRKEEVRVAGWCNRLAVDRNLGVELVLRNEEAVIASDPVLHALCHSQNTEQLVGRRLEELLHKIQGQCFINGYVVEGFSQQIRQYMEGLVAEGVSISPDSHFIYSRNQTKGSFYTAVFSYYSEKDGPANLIVEIAPRTTNNVQIPPSYSYAKYESGRLSSFSGTYAYPTVLPAMVDSSREGKGSFTLKGYRHFVNRIDADQVIVVSRREERGVIYIITFTYLVFLLLLIANVFRRRERLSQGKGSRFSIRMLTLVISSLVVTLIVMAGVSVLFVYQRNELNMNNTLSSRISTIQVMLDGACRQMPGPEGIQTAEFRLVLDEVSRNTGASIDIYSPQGRLLVSNSQRSTFRRAEVRSLISPEAFRSIILDHQRYFIEKNRRNLRNSYMLYAPVMNASGKTVAIVATPYIQLDYDFTRDAVFHTATVISLFLILLFITVLIASSIVKAIFRPLVDMGSKMKGADANSLEPIVYDGEDEISTLVKAYNTMVVDLQESTGKLAAAERDKAWSEMARQVAHEIKNPLTPIKLEIQRLQRLKQKNAPGWEAKFDSVSSVILEHIDILSQTANEFSTFAKLYSEPSISIDLDKTLKEQIMLFENRGVDITYLGSEGAVVEGPKPQLIRVFVNLLTNAVQAVEGSQGPKILVSLRKGSAAGVWDIVFEDNGPGVSLENQSRLFTPNFTTKSSGTGLGLAICRSIVDRCGGSISYSRSFTLGGACFTVSLPENPKDYDTTSLLS